MIIRGTRLPVRKSLRTRFDPARGQITTQEYESAGEGLGGLASQAQAAGYDVDHTINPIRSRLVISTTGAAAGFGEKATSTWQLFTNDYQKDIRESPAAIALGPVVIKQIEAALQMMKTTAEQGYDEDWMLDGLPQTYEQFTSLTGPFPPGTTRKTLLDLLLHGVTSYEITFFSARATISVPFLYAGAVPGVAPDSLMATLINAIPVNGPNDGTLFFWGWRRIGTSRTFSGNTRTEISLEWRLGSWPPLVHNDITGLPA